MSVLGGLLKALVNRHYLVRGESMTPALRNGDVVLVTGLGRTESRPTRGDIVVAREPPPDGRRTIKRVVGLPGETVRFEEGLLYVDGGPLAEPYLGGLPAVLGLGEATWTVGPGEYFLLGDNRAHSTDSKDYGPVERSRIIGRAWWRYWPPGRAGRVG